MKPRGPNAEQIQYWNETTGPKWVRLDPLVDAQIRGLGVRAMEALALAPGEAVLDVGCGCGATTLALGRRVTSAGRVLGVDVSRAMLARAEERVQNAGAAHVAFLDSDAQTHRFAPATFDAVFSRFGVMFFVDPRAAFANLRAALRPGGRLAFVCWQALERNPWLAVPMRAAARHVQLPDPTSPDRPGPFSLADPVRLRSLLDGTGLADVVLTPVAEPLALAGGVPLEQAVEFALQIGPAAAALREADPAVRPAIAAAVHEALVPFAAADGVRLPSAAWLVTAHRPPAS